MDFEPKNDLTDAYSLFNDGLYASPFLFNSPHSGRCYSDGFRKASKLDEIQLRASEDAFIDLIFADLPALGLPFMRANFPRAYLDLNREPYELDPTMFCEPLPSYVKSQTPRVGSGLGTIARIVCENQEIYRHKLTLQDALDRIELYYKPYHKMLRHQLARIHVKHGYACLIDCHSMPSRIFRHLPERQQPDIILGDRYGMACHNDLTEAAYEILSDLGFRVALNNPYAGGFITQHYGRPAKGLHALQIELNRALYMNEETIQPNQEFFALQKQMASFSQSLSQCAHQLFRPAEAAAE
ncbi:MAG: N-formylglutamate amidohydrolase [Cohaesibacter sp.]|nr:N-formylglutamate amidohydrolase [Cohaesibacter sp.]